MQQNRLVVLGIVALTLASGAAEARNERLALGPRAFVGLWQGIDPFDGSVQLLSIACSDQTTCDVRLTDTVFTDCDGGTGFAQGEGIIEDDLLAVETFDLTCNDGTSLIASEVFVPDFANGTLINLDARSDISPPTAFHRLSQ